MGYRTEKGTKRIHVDPAKSETVQAVFGFRRAHPEWSLRKLEAAMDGAGYTTTEGKPFGPMQIKRILDRQAFYAGEYRYREIRTDGQHVAILDPAEA
jgi:hypothetical protein